MMVDAPRGISTADLSVISVATGKKTDAMRGILVAATLLASLSTSSASPVASTTTLATSSALRWRPSEGSAAPTGDDWSAVPFPTAPVTLNATKFVGRFRTTGRAYNATLATFDARKWSVGLPPDGCKNHATTSSSAALLKCAYASNAGFFDFPPNAACEGNLVLASAVKQFTSTARVNVARNSTHTMIGYSSSATVASVAPSSLVSGLFWLVRDGAPNVKQSREFPATGNAPSFVTERAPRTGSGVRADGVGMTLALDGIEGTSEAAGADLYEFADLFIELGAVLAMNNDGGGSTTTALHGRVFNVPHCGDSWTVCERDVTSITCVSE